MEDSAPHFSNVEAVEDYAGFDIPHPRNLQGWRLEHVELVPTPEAPTHVHLTYRSETEDPLMPPSPVFMLAVPSPAMNIDLPDEPIPEPDDGPPQRIYLGGDVAMLQSKVLAEDAGWRPEFASAVVQWRVDGRLLLAKALVREDSQMFGAGLSLDYFLHLLETIS